jgi:hypothetical protein
MRKISGDAAHAAGGNAKEKSTKEGVSREAFKQFAAECALLTDPTDRKSSESSSGRFTLALGDVDIIFQRVKVRAVTA